jgi:uncharacterized Zn finger protein
MKAFCECSKCGKTQEVTIIRESFFSENGDKAACFCVLVNCFYRDKAACFCVLVNCFYRDTWILKCNTCGKIFMAILKGESKS